MGTSAGVAARLLLLSAATMAAIGVAGRFLSWPLLTATLGPTLYVFIAHPESEGARFRNSAVGHTLAVAVGLAMLAAFGLWSHPSVANMGHPSLRQAGAAAASLGLTMLALHVTNSHHAPAAATTLLVATGLARPGRPLFGLLVGLAVLISLGPLIGRLPIGRRAMAESES